MPRYRLIADHGHPFDDFTAEDHHVAERIAREMAEHAPTAKGTGYHLEIQGEQGGGHDGDEAWRSVLSWVPRWVAFYPGGLNKTLPPRKP